MNRHSLPLLLVGLVASIDVALADTAQSVVTRIAPNIVRVQWRQDGQTVSNNTGVCTYTPAPVSDQQSLTLLVQTDPLTGALTFSNAVDGRVLLAEDPAHPHSSEPVVRERITYDEQSAHTVMTANGQVTERDILRRDTIGLDTRYHIAFRCPGTQALYGLGSHMEDYMNLLGHTLYLTQHNLKATVPFIISPQGYGILIDAGCAMKFTSQAASAEATDPTMSFQLEAAQELDYYVIQGQTMQDIIAGYHYLTGPVSMMPRYVFGYTQSKERYASSAELISIVREYRSRHIPLDMIVQDWNYWPQGWGYMKMDPRFYPDPAALADTIHQLNARLMVSIWPNPQWCPEAEDFKARGYMLPHDVYDVFNPEARSYYWKYANDEFFSRGFDAWWCDSSEPLDGDWNQLPKPGPDGRRYGWDDHERRWHLNADVLSEALGAERSSLYSLYHSRGIYEHQRLATSAKRVVNLTRSTYAGQQRYGTIVWNGDTHASWASFRQQIPAGLNYMATGNPYWTVDVGSFFTRGNGRQWFYTGEFPEGCKSDAYRDYYTRMFQWGTFLPMLRSHGSDTPREIWRFGEPGTKYYDAILHMIHLRYRLLPYTYSMADAQTRSSYTMARLLAFDFPDDPAVYDLKDEYLFGSFLVCPVTEPEATSRRVYLPKGSLWFEYGTFQVHEGGQWLDAACALGAGSKDGVGEMPLFVRGGSIIPTSEVVDYADAQRDCPLTITVYPGADADFTLYDDEGDNYNFEQGACARIPLHWDNWRRRLTIGRREGQYPGMPAVRTITVRTPRGERTIQYKGRPVTLKF